MELPGASGFQRCLEALHAAFPALNVVDAAPIDDGWDNYVIEINKSLIFRFPGRVNIQQKLATDVRLLPELAKALPLPIPSLDYIATKPGNDGQRLSDILKFQASRYFSVRQRHIRVWPSN